MERAPLPTTEMQNEQPSSHEPSKPALSNVNHDAEIAQTRADVERLEETLKNSGPLRRGWLKLTGQLPKDPEFDLDMSRQYLAHLEESREAEQREQASREQSRRNELRLRRAMTPQEAAAMARITTPPLFDPAKNIEDRRTHERLTSFDERLLETRERTALTTAEYRKRDEDLARFGPLRPFPRIGLLFKLSAVCAIAVSFCPLLHDFLTGLQPVLRWAAASLCASAFAYFIVAAALPPGQPEDTHADDPAGPGFQGVMLAGVVTSVAFFVARLSLARNYRDLFIATGTALMEIGVLVFVERRGAKLRNDRSRWAVMRDERRRLEGLRQAGWDEWDRHIKSEAEIESWIKEIEDTHIKGRVHGADVEANVALCVAAVRKGYVSEVAINKAMSVVPEERE